MATSALDRVVWEALTTTQRDLAEGDALARRYPAEMAPFAATLDTTGASFNSLLALLPPGDRLALVTTSEPAVPSGFAVLVRERVDQMVREAGGEDIGSDAAHVTLDATDVAEMQALVESTRPGPFGPRTIEMGCYLGLRRDGRLVAMAGERMRLDGYTEVSAVCVDPALRGRGLAADMVLAVAGAISRRGEVPFLHVFAANAPAIARYRKLGFTLRRSLHLTVLARAGAGVRS